MVPHFHILFYCLQVKICKQDRLKAIERQKQHILEGKRAKKRKLEENEVEIASSRALVNFLFIYFACEWLAIVAYVTNFDLCC